MRIVNRTKRLFNFPPLTIWPKEAKAIRHPGESVSVMTLPDGSLAEPVKVYRGVDAPPGVTVDQPERQARPNEKEIDIPRKLLSETHGPEYWDVIMARAKKHIENGDIAFKADSEPESGEEAGLRKMAEKARGAPAIKDRPEKEALQFIDLEDRKETLLEWRANETRPRVRKALNEKIANTR